MEEEGGCETMNQRASHAKMRRALRCALRCARCGQWRARGSEEDRMMVSICCDKIEWFVVSDAHFSAKSERKF